MPIRKVPLVDNEIYHIFNRGIDKRSTFNKNSEFIRAYQTLNFYRFASPPVKLSKFLELTEKRQTEILNSIRNEKLVSIFCYCLMPNHFHLLLKQESENGISKFVGQFLNSYTKYFNLKNNRTGALFLDEFKNVLVGREEQLIHLSRYIHLNPYSSGIVQNLEGLEKYEWSSLDEYIHATENGICDKEIIMNYFKTKESYKKFVLNNADYQRELKKIEHAILE